MIKNKVIELFDNSTKQIIYTALENNKNIMYTKNERSVPIRTKSGIENIYTCTAFERNYTLAIKPDKQQLEYMEFNVISIAEAIEKDIEINELKDFLNKESKDTFITAIDSSHFSFSNQYDTETVYNYILSC